MEILHLYLHAHIHVLEQLVLFALDAAAVKHSLPLVQAGGLLRVNATHLVLALKPVLY